LSEVDAAGWKFWYMLLETGQECPAVNETKLCDAVNCDSRILFRKCPMRVLLVLLTILVQILLTTDRVTLAADPVKLTAGHFLARLARQPRAARPPLFNAAGEITSYQIALVIDGTTSMKQELAELPNNLRVMASVLSQGNPEKLQMAVVIYRDTRSPSGPVTVVSDFTRDLDMLVNKLRDVKAETGEPFFPEAMDQGLHSALESLAWSEDAPTLRRMLIIGDAPPYSDDHANRKYHDVDLHRQINDKKIRVDALLVNSGFVSTSGGEDGTSQDSATKSAPYAREFLGSLATRSSGVFVDFWNADQMATLLEPTVLLTELTPLPAAQPEPTVSEEIWRTFLSRNVASVRAERPALRALAALSNSKLRPAEDSTLFPSVWSIQELESVLVGLEESLDEEPDNAALHLLLANTHSLLATADAFEDHSQSILKHVVLAHSVKTDATAPFVRDEIDALFALHILNDSEAAVKYYLKLNTKDAEAANPGCRKRAVWGLLALEAGFWPLSSPDSVKSVNKKTCQDLVFQILKQWPDSVEGQALRKLIELAGNNPVEIPRSLFMAPRAG
jgi:hypothetical protein